MKEADTLHPDGVFKKIDRATKCMEPNTGSYLVHFTVKDCGQSNGPYPGVIAETCTAVTPPMSKNVYDTSDVPSVEMWAVSRMQGKLIFSNFESNKFGSSFDTGP